MFLQEPKNVTVAERMDAFFAYSYRGTSGVPSWRINDTVFVISALPPKHSYNGSGLVVNSVDLSLNMTTELTWPEPVKVHAPNVSFQELMFTLF